jgi:hypothetical protein
MRKLRTTILAGAAALLAAGTAHAATDKVQRMNVALPDGSVAQIEYVGEVAPRVKVEPADARRLVLFDPFAGFERIAAMMEAQRRAMLLQMAALEQAAMQAAIGAPTTTLVGGVPGTVRYSYVSSTTDANGCTRTVEYRSDGSGAEPRVTQASAGNCDSLRPAPGPIPVGTLATSETDREPGQAV